MESAVEGCVRGELRALVRTIFPERSRNVMAKNGGSK